MSQPFFYYVKGPKKGGVWTPVPEDEPDRLNGRSVYFRTILACSARVSAGRPMPDPAQTLYRGPFYIDIDADAAKTAHATAMKSIEALGNIGVREEDIYVWLSGKKGYHILVPQECFMPAEPTLWLPRIYKHLAADLKLGIDYRVYSMGRGRMWRVSGKQRPDNHLYKVAVSLQELSDMRPAEYVELCREPREDHVLKPGTPVRGAGARLARAIAKSEEDRKVQAVFIDPDSLEALQDEEFRLPPCGQMMVHGDVRPGIGFNDLSVQFSKVLASFGGEDPDHLIELFSENTHGDTYNTPSKRATHVRSALPAAKQYNWSCRSALSVLPGSPCESCPVAYLLLDGQESSEDDDDEEGLVDLSEIEDASEVPVVRLNGSSVASALPENPAPKQPASPAEFKEVTDIDSVDVDSLPVFSMDSLKASKPAKPEKPAKAEKPKSRKSKAKKGQEEKPKREVPDVDYQFDLANAHGLIADETGYGFLADKGTVRYVCNFTIRITKVYHEWIAALQEERRVAVMCDVFQGFTKVGKILIEEPSWETKGAMLKALSGLSNLVFHGKDDDVQKMKAVLMEKVGMYAENVRKVHAYGIHHEEVAGQDLFTYVEPGWSYDCLGQENKFSLLGNKPEDAPCLVYSDEPEKGSPTIRRLVQSFMTLNEPLPAAQITGWVLACFIKRHIEVIGDRQFPLINVYGNAASGKTQGMLRWCQLFGTPSRRRDPVNAPSAKDFQIWKSLSDSETSAVILDEFNLSKLGKKRYNDIAEYLKQVYQRGSVKRGSLTSDRSAGRSPFGAELLTFPLCAPTAVCSEQGMSNLPAMITRTVQIAIRPRGLDWNNNQPRRSFSWIGEHPDEVMSLSRALYMLAIRTSIEEVREAYQKELQHVPVDLGDRPRHCYTVILTGLWFLRKACTYLDLELDNQIDDMHAEICQLFLATEEMAELQRAKARSEVDIVMDTMGIMAAQIHDADMSKDALKQDIHYKVIEGVLWLNVSLAFQAYKRYMNVVEREIPVISHAAGFIELIRNEPYYVGARRIEGLGQGAPSLGLSLRLMEEKGIVSQNFMINEDD